MLPRGFEWVAVVVWAVAALLPLVAIALLDRGLTECERVGVMGVYAGKTHAELVRGLFLPRSTVATYRKRAYEKLDAENKDALVAYLDGVA